MMAVMLDQLGLAPGQRVLEIGTGTGYNAALLAHLVADQRSVVTIEVDREVAGRARATLAGAGYGGITVLCADGALSPPQQAPFDRIIVTAGAWDIPPAWLARAVRRVRKPVRGGRSWPGRRGRL
jgi:protein-L-isoaspartate(D-aspartate) O-methyltransferase